MIPALWKRHPTAEDGTAACLLGRPSAALRWQACRSNSGAVPCPHLPSLQVVLAVSKTAEAAAVDVGGTARFSMAVSNTGTGTARGVKLTDTLPAGLSWAVDAPATGCAIADGALTCTLGDIAGGATSDTVTISATTATAGSIDNKASAAADNHGSVESGTATITVNAPVPVSAGLSGQPAERTGGGAAAGSAMRCCPAGGVPLSRRLARQ